MIPLIHILLLFISLNFHSTECTFTKEDLKTAVEKLYKKDILNIEKDSLTILFDKNLKQELDFSLDDVLKISNKTIAIKSEFKQGNHWLAFHHIQSSQSNGRINLHFRAKAGAYSYQGHFVFVCEEGIHMLLDLKFISSIE